MPKIYVATNIKCPSEFYEKYNNDCVNYVEIPDYIGPNEERNLVCNSYFGCLRLRFHEDSHEKISELNIGNYAFFKMEYSNGECIHFYGYDTKVNPWCAWSEIEIIIEIGGEIIKKG